MMVRNVTMDGGFLAMLLWTIFFFFANPGPEPGIPPQTSIVACRARGPRAPWTMLLWTLFLFFANPGLHPNDYYG